MARPVARSAFAQPKQITPAAYFQAVRCYSASAGLSKDEVQGRIMDLLKNFDKVRAKALEDVGLLANLYAGPGYIKGTCTRQRGTGYLDSS